jgi:hypothetical protein
MSKLRRHSGGRFDDSELFSDNDFDAGEFVEHMDTGTSHVRAKARSGWRRLEELREEKILRAELEELGEWDDFDTE